MVAALLLTPGSSGWWGSNITEPEPEGPWRQWARSQSPTLVRYWDETVEGFESVRSTVSGWVPSSWDIGLWSVCDGLLGLAGWRIFGTAWGDVRNGCKRLAQIAMILVIYALWRTNH